jgi:hypothetical protein
MVLNRFSLLFSNSLFSMSLKHLPDFSVRFPSGSQGTKQRIVDIESAHFTRRRAEEGFRFSAIGLPQRAALLLLSLCVLSKNRPARGDGSIHESATYSGNSGEIDPKSADHQWKTPARGSSQWQTGNQVQESATYSRNSGEIDPKWADHQWNTPARGSSQWQTGYQVHESAIQSCMLNSDTVRTAKSARPPLLPAPASIWRSNAILTTPSNPGRPQVHVRIQNQSGETVVLSVAFYWNIIPEIMCTLSLYGVQIVR